MPHRFFSGGHVQGTYRPEQERHRVFSERSDFQYGRVCRLSLIHIYRYENRVVHHYIEIENAELIEQNA